jgi:hypothetical protein
MASKYPWIMACDGTNPDYPFGFACERCGAKESVGTRIPMDAWQAWAKSFTRRHKGCKEKAGA